MATPSPKPIAYAPKPTRLRRLLRARVVVPLTLLVLIGTMYCFRRPLWQRVELVYWYHRCERYEPRPGVIAWDVNDGPPGQVRGRDIHVPPEWTKLYALLSPPGLRSDGTLFLGARRTPDGRKMLVAVDALAVPRPNGWSFRYDPTRLPVRIRTFTHAGGLNLPRQQIENDLTLRLPKGLGSFDILPGATDPGDPTHFTIPITGGARIRVIDGWLRNDRVELVVRR